MEKEASPLQLDLPLDSSIDQARHAAEKMFTPASSSSFEKHSGVVLDFPSVRANRYATVQANLYRQILDTVRHLG